MILFLDSNVTIGYVFEGDDFNNHAVNVLNCKNDKYFSDNVVKETERKITKIKDEIHSKILSLIYFIRRNKNNKDYLTLDELERMVHTPRFKRIEVYIIKLFLKLYNYETSKEEFLTVLTNLANDFFTYYPNKINELHQKLTLHIRKKSYKTLSETLNCIHNPDRDIYIDAHDLCKCINPPLTFITSDFEEKKVKFVTNNTDITRIKDLREFEFKKQYE